MLVRSLILHCTFPRAENGRMNDLWYPFEGYNDIYGPVTAALSQMPKLHTITITQTTDGGLPWEAINAMVEVPQLRHLHFNIMRIDDRYTLHPNIERSLRLRVTALNTLEYNTYDLRPLTSYSPIEVQVFSVLLGQAATQRSLERLSIPSSCAPLDWLSTRDWPNLHELTLYGQRRQITSSVHGRPPIPYIFMLANMPRLQSLKLMLSQPANMKRQAIWPPGMDCEHPCPDLRELVVSYPHPDDEIYTHLPSTLRLLSLRCWPRHYLHFLPHDIKGINSFGWSSPVLTASEMLRILRRCPSSSIHHLELEFEEDSAGGDLFSFLPAKYPQLRHLIIHRYRGTGSDVSSVVSVGPIFLIVIDVLSLDQNRGVISSIESTQGFPLPPRL